MIQCVHFPNCSGDQDSVVPLLGSRTLVRELAQDLQFQVTVPYGAWFHQKQVLFSRLLGLVICVSLMLYFDKMQSHLLFVHFYFLVKKT